MLKTIADFAKKYPVEIIALVLTAFLGSLFINKNSTEIPVDIKENESFYPNQVDVIDPEFYKYNETEEIRQLIDRKIAELRDSSQSFNFNSSEIERLHNLSTYYDSKLLNTARQHINDLEKESSSLVQGIAALNQIRDEIESQNGGSIPEINREGLFKKLDTIDGQRANYTELDADIKRRKAKNQELKDNIELKNKNFEKKLRDFPSIEDIAQITGSEIYFSLISDVENLTVKLDQKRSDLSKCNEKRAAWQKEIDELIALEPDLYERLAAIDLRLVKKTQEKSLKAGRDYYNLLEEKLNWQKQFFYETEDMSQIIAVNRERLSDETISEKSKVNIILYYIAQLNCLKQQAETHYQTLYSTIALDLKTRNLSQEMNTKISEFEKSLEDLSSQKNEILDQIKINNNRINELKNNIKNCNNQNEIVAKINRLISDLNKFIIDLKIDEKSIKKDEEEYDKAKNLINNLEIDLKNIETKFGRVEDIIAEFSKSYKQTSHFQTTLSELIKRFNQKQNEVDEIYQRILGLLNAIKILLKL